MLHSHGAHRAPLQDYCRGNLLAIQFAVRPSDSTEFVSSQSGSMIQRDAKTAFHLPTLSGGSPTNAGILPNLAGRRARFGGWSVWITCNGPANPGGGVWLIGGFQTHAGWRVLLICRLLAMICRSV